MNVNSQNFLSGMEKCGVCQRAQKLHENLMAKEGNLMILLFVIYCK